MDPNWSLPKGIELIYPFNNEFVWQLMNQFYSKYYDDNKKRHFLFGINPGRLGAGMTGIPFTDPLKLKLNCNIDNDLNEKSELSSIFIYEMIEALGGPSIFYSKYYIGSLCPLGFLKDSKNYNYYDSQELYQAVKKHIVNSINKQMKFPCYTNKAFSIGKGKNLKYFRQLNEEHQWFDEIIPLPHPRWVLQYKSKSKDQYINEYIDKLDSK